MQPLFAASAALLLAVIGHIVALRSGARHVCAYGISLAVGLCAVLAAAFLMPSGDVIGSAAIAALLFCAWWFVFLNFFQSSQSSLRVNILRHIAVHGGRLDRGQLFIKYNDDALIRLRLERLVQGGGIVERDGRYFVASAGLRTLARFFLVAKNAHHGPGFGISLRHRPKVGNGIMISFIVCAFNEEKNIAPTVDTLQGALRAMAFPAYEIIIVDDGSSDGTYARIEQLMAQFPQVRSVRHPVNMGMGTAIRSGIAAAAYPQFMIIPGDNDVHHDFIVSMLSFHDQAELILSAPLNKEIRSIWRNVVSMLYQMFYMVSFGLFLNYINGPGVWPTERVRQLGLRARRFSIISEMNVKLLRSGCTFAEVPGYFQAGPKVRSTITLRNLLEVAGSYFGLLYEIYIRAPKKFSARPTRVPIRLINVR